MNIKIKELINKVGTDVSGKWVDIGNVEVFAELIIKECAGKVDWILAEGGKTQGDLIKQHFGIE
jgi:hypothetical protein